MDTFQEPPEEYIELLLQNLDLHPLYPRTLSSFARHILPVKRSLPILETLLDSSHTPSLRGKWWEHRTHLQPELPLLLEAIADPWTRGPQLMKVRRRLFRKYPTVVVPPQLQARLVDRTLNTWRSITIWADKIPDGLTGYKSRWLPSPSPVMSEEEEEGADGSQVGDPVLTLTVEQVTIAYYTSCGYKGMHLENTLIQHLFTLLFFDILFFVAPDFPTEFMTAPNDLGTPEFFERRAQAITSRVGEIRDWGQPCLGDQLLELDERLRSYPVRALGLNWSLPHTVLGELVHHLPCHGTAVVCESLALNWGRMAGRAAGSGDLECHGSEAGRGERAR